MKKKMIRILMSILLVGSLLTGCATTNTTQTSVSENGIESMVETSSISGNETTSLEDMTEICMTELETVKNVSVTYAENDDYAQWVNKEFTTIALNGDSVTTSGSGVNVEGSDITITDAGYYSLSGTLTDGSITITAAEDADVFLLFDGVTITCSDGAVIKETAADKVVISLVEGTQNTITDGSTYVATGEDDANAAIYCQDSLTINGTGSLTVNANYNNGITSKDTLKIMEGILTVNAVDDALLGKDLVAIKNGTFTITCSGDAIKSNQTEDAEKGMVVIEGGTFQITAGADAIQASTAVNITDGNFTIKTDFAEGTLTAETETESETEDSASAKAIKSSGSIYIGGGTFQITSADDAIHGNGFVGIENGTITITSEDDGIHADSELYVTGGTITITKSYEGLEAANIIIAGGDIDVTATDDGLNAAGGNDASSVDGRAGQNSFEGSGDYQLSICGGNLVVNASGDGLDSNGNLYMSGGTALVSGPVNDGNAVLDFGTEFAMTGGTLLATGSSGMLQTISTSSTQFAVTQTLDSTQAAGTVVTLKDGETVISTFEAAKEFNAIIICTKELVEGKEYTLSYGTESATVTAEAGTQSSQMGQGPMGGGRMEDGTAPSGEMPTLPDGEAPTAPQDGTRPSKKGI